MLHEMKRWARRYWVFLAALMLLVLAFGVAAPAWAAPPSAQKYQTVPKPTPRPDDGDDDAVPTATPRPDDDDGGSPDAGDRTVPVFVIDQEETEAPLASALTASVTVAQLNVRSGPGTEYPVIGSLTAGDVVNVLWRNAANTWLYVCCIPGSTTGGWVSSQLLSLNFDRATSADVVPLFDDGSESAAAETAQSASAASSGSALPLQLSLSLSPELIAQGETGLLVLQVTNPNQEPVLNVEVSDQLPPELELVSVAATAGGTVSQRTGDTDSSLVVTEWASIPAGGSARVVLTVRVADSLTDGAVFDNLAGAQGSNTGYASAGVTIGMPPALLPDFQ